MITHEDFLAAKLRLTTEMDSVSSPKKAFTAWAGPRSSGTAVILPSDVRLLLSYIEQLQNALPKVPQNIPTTMPRGCMTGSCEVHCGDPTCMLERY